MANADSLGTDARDLVDLVVGYAKQETVDPIKRLGKAVALGMLGAVLTGTGAIFLALSALRALQTETDIFADDWSFVPYVGLAVLLGVAALIGWKTLGPPGLKKERR